MIKRNTDRLIDWVTGWDIFLSDKLGIAEEPGLLRTFFIIVTKTGDGAITLALFGLAYLIGGPAVEARIILLVLVDTLTFLVIQGLKIAVKRPRPEGMWGQMYRKMDPHSFPSGHSARGGVLAAMGLIMGPWQVGVAMLVWGLLMATSRIAMNVHYVSDAVVGFSVGVLISILSSVMLFVVLF